MLFAYFQIIPRAGPIFSVVWAWAPVPLVFPYFPHLHTFCVLQMSVLAKAVYFPKAGPLISYGWIAFLDMAVPSVQKLPAPVGKSKKIENQNCRCCFIFRLGFWCLLWRLFLELVDQWGCMKRRKNPYSQRLFGEWDGVRWGRIEYKMRQSCVKEGSTIFELEIST